MNKAELDQAPDGAVILTGDGYAFQKNRGKWKAWFDKQGSSSAMMLDPDKCGQPLTVIHMPDEPSML